MLQPYELTFSHHRTTTARKTAWRLINLCLNLVEAKHLDMFLFKRMSLFATPKPTKSRRGRCSDGWEPCWAGLQGRLVPCSLGLAHAHFIDGARQLAEESGAGPHSAMFTRCVIN